MRNVYRDLAGKVIVTAAKGAIQAPEGLTVKQVKALIREIDPGAYNCRAKIVEGFRKFDARRGSQA